MKLICIKVVSIFLEPFIDYFQLEGKDQEVSEVTVEQTETVEEKKEEVTFKTIIPLYIVSYSSE